MNSSPQEKEELRKRLQKLFQKEENQKKSSFKFSSNSYEDNRISKDNRNNSHISKNVAKQDKLQSKSSKISDIDTKQSSFSKKAKKKNSNGNLTSTTGADLKKKKPNVSKEQNLQENSKTKKSSVSQQSVLDKAYAPKDKKIKKQVADKSTLKGTTNKKKLFDNIQCEKIKDTKAKNNSRKNFVRETAVSVSKSERKKGKKSTAPEDELNNFTEGQQTVPPNKSGKKERKRPAQTDDVSNNFTALSKKKQKLAKEHNKKIKLKKKINGKPEKKFDKSDSSCSEQEEYTVNGMTGCVGGGDFDYSNSEEDEMDYEYCNPENVPSSSSPCNFEVGNAKQRHQKLSKASLKQSNLNEIDDTESDFSDYSYEEEEENYSDFDEDDYEEDEDSYSYSTESDDASSSNYTDCDGDLLYDFDGSDEDYVLPKHIPEDLIIHNGTASKRELKPDDNVTFDSTEETQIVELENENTVKVIYQPKAYEKNELLKLKCKVKEEASSSDSDDCPQLVPIGIEAHYLRQNNLKESLNGEREVIYEKSRRLEQYEIDSMVSDDVISLGSEYTEVNTSDMDSLTSEDINGKYLRCYDENDVDIRFTQKILDDKPTIIDATDYAWENTVYNYNESSPKILNDAVVQLPSVHLFENVNYTAECEVLSCNIVDDEVANAKIEVINERHSVTSTKPDKTTDYSVIPMEDLQNANEHKHSATSIKPDHVAESPVIPMEDLQNTNENKHSITPIKPDQAAQSPVIPMKDLQNAREHTGKVSKPFVQKLTDYNTKFFNAFDSNLVIVLLRDPFYIYGTVRLTLLVGAVEVYGHSLALHKEVEVFSPRGCSVIEIGATKRKCALPQDDLKQLLRPYQSNFALRDLKAIVKLFNSETDAVILLKRNDSRKKIVKQFKKFMNENVFPNISNIGVDRPLYNSEYLLRCMINTSAQEEKCLRLPEQWQQLTISSRSRVMLIGGKGVGKSTLLRYLINRHLPQQVLLIDLDIGQPEVFVPQTISCTVIKEPLLGPGFLLNLQPEMSYAIGHTNIVLCARTYINAARSLIDFCKAQEEYQSIPWIINTMGYNKGFGTELISVIAQDLPLTDVVQFQSAKETNNFETALHPHALSSVPLIVFSKECDDEMEKICKKNLNYRLHLWQSAVQPESRYQKDWEMTAKDFRFAILLARLSDALHGHGDWLTDIKPFSVSLDNIKIINLVDSSITLPLEVLEKSIEANLVYLCQYEDLAPLKCLGIGVVRAIDFNIRILYLIPALPYDKLADVNCLAIGEMPLPSSLFTNQGPRIKNIAPFVYNIHSANASKAIRQIYCRPNKFISGKPIATN